MTTNFPVVDSTLNTKLPASLGQKTSANSLAVVLASDQALTVTIPTGAASSAKQDTANTSLASVDTKLTNVGTTADTVATSDTGSFSLLALFKRLLQLISGTAPVTAAEALFSATATPQSIVAANAARRRLIITNPSANTVRLGLSTVAGTAFANCPIILVAGESWVETQAATSAWYGVLESGTANVPYQTLS